MTAKYNPLLADLAAFQAMSYGQRRAAGRRARREAAASGFLNRAGKRTVKHPDGEKSRIMLFSKEAQSS